MLLSLISRYLSSRTTTTTTTILHTDLHAELQPGVGRQTLMTRLTTEHSPRQHSFRISKTYRKVIFFSLFSNYLNLMKYYYCFIVLYLYFSFVQSPVSVCLAKLSRANLISKWEVWLENIYCDVKCLLTCWTFRLVRPANLYHYYLSNLTRLIALIRAHSPLKLTSCHQHKQIKEGIKNQTSQR